MKQDGKENMLTLWNAQHWCCMAERKETYCLRAQGYSLCYCYRQIPWKEREQIKS